MWSKFQGLIDKEIKYAQVNLEKAVGIKGIRLSGNIQRDALGSLAVERWRDRNTVIAGSTPNFHGRVRKISLGQASP